MKNTYHTIDITVPRNGLVVRVNTYWACVDGDPTKAIFFGNSPQCNVSESLVKHFIDKELYKDFSNNVIPVFIEVSYEPNRHI